jgi:acyl-CoA reductase-like NAD-dependent aldehyde dehydrogenase
MFTVPLLINGQDVTTAKTIDVTNPSTGKVIHLASSAGVPEAIQAVEAAQAAFESWAATPPNIKRDIFLRAADILEKRTEEVGKFEEEEAGASTFYASGFDVPTAVNGLRDVAGKISGIVGTVPYVCSVSSLIMFSILIGGPAQKITRSS